MSEQDQEKAAKRAQWEEINRAKALAKQQQKEAAAAVTGDGQQRVRPKPKNNFRQ